MWPACYFGLWIARAHEVRHRCVQPVLKGRGGRQMIPIVLSVLLRKRVIA